MTEADLNQQLARVSHTVTFETLSEMSVSVASNVKGIIQIDPFTQFDQSYP